MDVRKYASGKKAMYHFDTGAIPQFFGEGKTPEAAVKDGLGRMRDHALTVAQGFVKVVAAVYPIVLPAVEGGK